MKRELLIDTQVLSYAQKGNSTMDIEGLAISSFTAIEYLLMKSSQPTKANYYVPILTERHGESHDRFRDHPFPKLSTDEVRFDFASNHPSFIEFGNLAIASIIKKKNYNLFKTAISHLDKDRQKLLKDKMTFLFEMDIECIPLSRSGAKLSLELLHEFSNKYKLKQDFKNEFFDLAIASTAIDSNLEFYTKDSKLSRFLVEHLHAPCSNFVNYSLINFPSATHGVKAKKRESKGYINKSWRISFQKNFCPK